MGRRARTPTIVACLTTLTLALTVSAAIGARSANWKSAAFVFAGSGQYSYRYAPGRSSKSQKVTMTWTIEWRLKPNEGHAKTVSEKIDGRSTYVDSNPANSCGGNVEKQPNVLAPLNPTGSKGKKTLLGAAVPLTGYLAHVPACAGKPGEGIAVAYYGPTAYGLHKLANAEVAFDATNPKSQKLQYNRRWQGSGSQGDLSSVSWNGSLTVKVTR